jgi:hypothetical protein
VTTGKWRNTYPVSSKLFNYLTILQLSNSWTKVIFIISWSLLSYSLIQCIDIFILLIQSKLLHFILIGIVHIAFYFFCIILLGKKYGHQFNYGQYLAISIFYSVLIWLYSFIYFELIKITDMSFDLNRYFILLVLNLILSSIVFSKKMKLKE